MWRRTYILTHSVTTDTIVDPSNVYMALLSKMLMSARLLNNSSNLLATTLIFLLLNGVLNVVWTSYKDGRA